MKNSSKSFIVTSIALFLLLTSICQVIADCYDIIPAAQCPNLTPTSGNCDTCAPYYSGQSITTYVAFPDGSLMSSCVNNYTVNVSFTMYSSAGQLCGSLTPNCNYVGVQMSDPCQTAHCQDYCYQG